MTVALLAQREPAFATVTKVDIDDLDSAARTFATQQSSVAAALATLGRALSDEGASIGKDRTADLFAPTYYAAADAITDMIRSIHGFVGGVAEGLAGSATDHERADRIPQMGWKNIEQTVPDHKVSTATDVPAPPNIASPDGHDDPQLDDSVRDVWASYDAAKMRILGTAWNTANQGVTDLKTTLSNTISAVTANNAGADIDALADFWKHYTAGEHSVGDSTAVFPVLYDAIVAVTAALDYYTGLVDRYQQRYQDAVQQVVNAHQPPGPDEGGFGWAITYLIEYFGGEIDQELHDAVAPVDDAMLAELQASQEFKGLTDVCVTRLRAAQRTLPPLQSATVEARQAADGAPSEQQWDKPEEAVLAAKIASDGHAVKSVPRDNDRRTPDSLVDGHPVEFKTIPSPNPSKIFTRLKESQRRGGQADRMALNITSNIPKQEVLRQIKRFFDEKNEGAIKDVTAYCADGSKVVYPPGEGL